MPEPIAHIAADPFEEHFDDDGFAQRLRARQTEVKRALLDQSLISGVGNIYADEALWRARLHGDRPTADADPAQGGRAAGRGPGGDGATRSAEGGTSFDSLYVNVNGESGYFDRSLTLYGRATSPAPGAGARSVREAFMNRSSYSCPRCQPGRRVSGSAGVTGSG